jgi:hypothetical protein
MKRMRTIGYFVWCLILTYAIYLMFLLSWPYTAMKPGIDFLATKQRVYHIPYWRTSFYLHVFTSLFALLAGLSQFNRKLLWKRPKVHRTVGLLYWVVVLFIASPTGFIMAIHANGGLPARTSFVMLSLLWFATTLLAMIAIKNKQWELHGEWMLRSYALTLSAITLRFYALLFDLFQVHARPQEVYITIAWLSWVPNLIIAEVLIKKGFVKQLLTKLD